MAEEYRAAGMTEEQIAEIAAFDLEVLRSDRRFYRHTQSLCPGGQGPEEAPEPSYDGSEPTLSGRLDWLEEIGDPALLELLKELSPEMLELLTLFVFEGYNQKQIARYLCCAKQNVSTKLLRLRRFLRRRLERAREAQEKTGCAEESAQP
jgi:DNA-directed RNA polymerase specialized sigma24 family protein